MFLIHLKDWHPSGSVLSSLFLDFSKDPQVRWPHQNLPFIFSLSLKVPSWDKDSSYCILFSQNTKRFLLPQWTHTLNGWEGKRVDEQVEWQRSELIFSTLGAILFTPESNVTAPGIDNCLQNECSMPWDSRKSVLYNGRHIKLERINFKSPHRVQDGRREPVWIYKG